MPVVNDGKGKGPKMFDGELNRKLGLNQKIKQVNENMALIFGSSKSKDDIRRLLRIIDEQDAINRYKWFGAPVDLSSQEIERLLYYKGSLCLFYCEVLDKFFITPYALEGTIDFYSRYNYVKPLPMASGEDVEKGKSKYDSQAAILSQMRLKVVKDVVFDEDLTYDKLVNSAVIIRDYTNQLSQSNIARSTLNEGILDLMSDYIPFLTTNLMVGTGVTGYRVQDSTCKDEVKAAASAIYNAALNKNPYVAITSGVQIQELTGSARNNAEDYLMAFQSLDNFRLSTYGIANGGVYEKKQHILESENAINYSTVMSAFEDGLKQRQHACDIANSLWGLTMWCEPSEAALGADTNGDGLVVDNDPATEEIPVEGANEAGGEE